MGAFVLPLPESFREFTAISQLFPELFKKFIKNFKKLAPIYKKLRAKF